MRFFYFTLTTLFFFSCNTNEINRKELIDFVPDNTIIIIKSVNIEGLKNSINNSDFLQEISKSYSYKNFENKLKNLSFINPSNEIIICISKDLNDSTQLAIATKYHKNLFSTGSFKDYSEETLSHKNKTITKHTIKNDAFYSTLIDSIFFASSSKTIIETIFDKKHSDVELKKIYKTLNNDKTCSVLLKTEHSFIKSFFIEDSINAKTFANYLALDIDINQNNLLINGVSRAIDSLSLINIFKNTVPQENQIQNVTPSNSDGLLSFTFNDFEIFKNNLDIFNKKKSTQNSSNLFNEINEIGVIYEDKNRAIVLNSIDIIATKDALLGEQTIVETYREVDIYSFSNPNVFSETFSPLIRAKQQELYCILDQFFVFSNNTEMLQNVIANYQNKTTLSYSDNFKNIKKQLSDASSLIQIVNPATLKSILNKNFIDENHNFNLTNYNTSAIQFIYDSNFAHVNAVVKRNQTKKQSNSVSEILNIKLDKYLLIDPQFVINHITKEKEIVVQDVNNNLYLISNKGKILWKKPIKGAILGRIEQIDIYKNGRLQLAFATPNNVYVIDRNGNNVAPFPGKFNDEITQPLSVFDYDKNKNYRLVVTQGNNVLMYNVNAKTVQGFNFKSTNESIINQPKHFRIGSKDYITFKTINNFFILDRVGKIRVKPKTSVKYSNQPVFLHNNTFTTTNIDGDLISIDIKGNITTKTINLSNKHSIDASSKTLVTLSENKLSIKNKTTELDFGDYTICKLFYLKDKIYVAVTDLQTHKIYLFDSQSNLISNFPVYGNSLIDLDNIDSDNNLEFVTKGEPNSIILYQIN